MADEQLTEILTNLKRIHEHSEENKAETIAAQAQYHSLELEVTKGFGSLSREVTGFGQKLDSHIGEDNRRFDETNGSISRLEGSSAATPGVSGKTMAVTGIAGSGVAGVILVLNWLREIMTGTPLPPS